MEKTSRGSIPRFLLIFAVTLVAFFALKYTLGILLPFIIAYAVSLVISPAARAVTKYTHVPYKLSSAILVLLALFLLGFLSYLGISRLYEEIAGLVLRLEARDEALISPIRDTFLTIRDFFSRFRFFETIENISGVEDVGKRVSEALFDSVYTLLSKIPEALATLVGKTPRLFIAFFVALMACYYFVSDKEKIKQGIFAVLPEGVQTGIKKYASGAYGALKGYMRGYFILMLLTFAESFIGLSVLRVRYSLALALLITVVDILPILGAGTVIVPWAVVLFIMRDFKLATGLLILYGIMTVIRQVAEPKIIGNSLGLHPLLMLFSTYAGLCLFGIWGIILGPAVALLIKTYLGETAEPVNQ